jgi:uncharacterized membrane protein YkvA (DUF1232 family)
MELVMSPNLDSLNVLQRIQLALNLMRDDRVAGWIKKVGPAAILAYVLSPVDVIPDFLLGPGQVDDLGIIAIGLVILLRMLVRFAPAEVVDEHVARIVGTPRWSGGAGRGETIETSGHVRR